MSEYPICVFQAIDRALSPGEIHTPRGYSTRADHDTSFTNEYSFGCFKGDEDRRMTNYFDAFEADKDLRRHAVSDSDRRLAELRAARARKREIFGLIDARGLE
jgi:hypothetical protein